MKPGESERARMHEIVQRYPILTGYLFTGNSSKAQLETLSIGDYGKHFNVKADFLGYTDEIDGVPLSEKWVITLSTQFRENA